MKKNLIGFIVSLFIAIIYSIMLGKLNYGFFPLLANAIGALLIPFIISLIVKLFYKNGEFNIIFIIATIAMCIISLNGHNRP